MELSTAVSVVPPSTRSSTQFTHNHVQLGYRSPRNTISLIHFHAAHVASIHVFIHARRLLYYCGFHAFNRRGKRSCDVSATRFNSRRE